VEDDITESDVAPSPLRENRHDALTLETAVKDLFAKPPLGKTTLDIQSPVFGLPVEKSFDLLKNSSTFTVDCSCKTLQRKVANESKISALPPLNDFGVAVGRKPLTPDYHLCQLVVALPILQEGPRLLRSLVQGSWRSTRILR
jgi:hypothetical protein